MFEIANDGAGRHGHDDVVAGAARSCSSPMPWSPRRRRPRVAIGVVEQRREVVVADDDHVAAAAAVAAVGAAQGHELLAAERDDARSAVARLHVHHDAIDEHRRYFPSDARPQQARRSRAHAAIEQSAIASSARVDHVRRRRRRSARHADASAADGPARRRAGRDDAQLAARSRARRDSTLPYLR